ncbi:MAG: hypothetical protein A2315_16530 [Ignavibacteria bacterium RIFOXYB2_FULL_35_12]|nr:MAG: hypothetical protein A2058_09870 [Ignavibacteria bacterium GWA2_36_19]OGU53805.1 MAG: hypothetical protein A2006_04815 [Ignavibacteria bacterium GWC2_35_8]OGU62792.1 MAG: hypothetical protein A2X60_04425 [Ignavibacteria bacterium GWF2_35_20]OGU79255.1 MAG: hypothetical protein A2254_09135 [Ignavibacteria bacterium RIFOXYA2_FULL_35_9]OGU83682.1 MAG: hypothetical protein A2W11_06850 [Ignavibacteria bacterium RBG_16_35_7]OGU87306.1 MAG: hypothetical protein A3K31_10240 [Ignavibacteria bac
MKVFLILCNDWILIIYEFNPLSFNSSLLIQKIRLFDFRNDFLTANLVSIYEDKVIRLKRLSLPCVTKVKIFRHAIGIWINIFSKP